MSAPVSPASAAVQLPIEDLARKVAGILARIVYLDNEAQTLEKQAGELRRELQSQLSDLGLELDQDRFVEWVQSIIVEPPPFPD